MIGVVTECIFLSYPEAVITPSVAVAESWKLAEVIVYGLISRSAATASPKEFIESALLLKKGATSITSIINDARITEGVKAEIIQKTDKNTIHTMLRIFSGVLKSLRIRMSKLHQREVCKPETASKWAIPLFLKPFAVSSAIESEPPKTIPSNIPAE